MEIQHATFLIGGDHGNDDVGAVVRFLTEALKPGHEVMIRVRRSPTVRASKNASMAELVAKLQTYTKCATLKGLGIHLGVAKASLIRLRDGNQQMTTGMSRKIISALKLDENHELAREISSMVTANHV